MALINTAQVAKILNIHRDSVRRLANRGLKPACRVGAALAYDEDEVLEFSRSYDKVGARFRQPRVNELIKTLAVFNQVGHSYADTGREIYMTRAGVMYRLDRLAEWVGEEIITKVGGYGRGARFKLSPAGKALVEKWKTNPTKKGDE